MKPFLISVIIPYYNKSKTIFRAVNSVLSQVYTHWELIIIDDCSSQPLSEVELPEDERIQLYRNYYNLGAGKTRQRGLNLANGEFIAFLDADDWWDTRFLEFCLNKILLNLNCDGVYVKSELVYKNNQIAVRKYADLNLHCIVRTIISYARPWQTGGILWRKTSCNDWGLLKTNEDAFFEVKSSVFDKLLPINEVLYFVDRTTESSLSNFYSLRQTAINHQELFLMIFREKRFDLSANPKITLYHRLIRGQLKIYEYCPVITANVFRDRLYEHSKFLGLICKSRLVLKLLHYCLQKSPFKINY